MSDQVATETQADSVDQSQVDNPNQQTESPADEVQTFSQEDMKKVRSEAANLRKRLKDAEAKVSEYETANQSDEERRSAEFASLQERAEKAEQSLRKANGRSAVIAKAGNAVSAEGLYRFVKDDIEFGDDGQPTNVDDLIKQARESEPSLFQRGSADGAPKGEADKGMNFNSAFRELAGKNTK